jgi:hypothetical protein
VKLGFALENLLFWLKRNPFRLYIHPTAAVEAIVRARGLQRRFYQTAGVWQVVVYGREGVGEGIGRESAGVNPCQSLGAATITIKHQDEGDKGPSMETIKPRNILFIINDGAYGSERAYNACAWP